MNNFFLLNDALNTTSISEFENGISSLNTILTEKNNETDVLMMHSSLWTHNNGLGIITDFYFSIVSAEIQRLIPKFFGSLSEYPDYIDSEIQFDRHFPGDCNAFKGIKFSGIPISSAKQITDSTTFKSFKTICGAAVGYTSIRAFWDARESLYPNLIFCDNVLGQIQHLSIGDDRFKLIIEKLSRLNNFTQKWTSGAFDFKSCGLNCSPDTPKRVEDTKTLRTFECPKLGPRVFNLHAKWYFGSEPFRLYFFPEASNHKVYIGYIGDKDGIGF
ncbi:hypothetical protein [Chitinophaga japonensis]|uniref:Uncharacterized protein n=1 Tax=Chitinophaga japonensis TaxID=104662 RepID=A0A562T6V2_CHIJA|nr:hypothetical protein [Chitinophaga japonensis]TWI89271.1 hypothetical protein LX66_3366 [Chitinophaga japonensis]